MAEEKYFTAEEVNGFVGRPVNPLFVYGSLMIPAIVANVIDRPDGRMNEGIIKSMMTAATLGGFQRFAIKNTIFPAVLDAFSGTSVEGLILFGLTSAQRGRIDNFEGGRYSREAHDVRITLASGKEEIIEADVYVWARDRSELQEHKERVWSLEEFVQTEFCKEHLSRVCPGN